MQVMPCSKNLIFVVFPFYSQTNNIRNLSASGGNNLAYSSGHSMPAMLLPSENDFGLTSAAYSELILAGDGGNVSFVVSLGVSTLI